MTEQKARYFQFPLFLMRDLLKDKNKCLNNILDYGIYNHTVKVSVNYDLMISETVRMINQKLIPQSIDKQLNEYKRKTESDRASYQLDRQQDELRKTLEENPKLKDDLQVLYKTRQAFNYFGIGGDWMARYENGKEIADRTPKGAVMANINFSQLVNFGKYDKAEDELLSFAVNVGIRSILGKQQVGETNLDMVFARAYGYDDMKELMIDAKVAEEFNERFGRDKKETYRYRTNKYINGVALKNWGLGKYDAPNRRGFCVAKMKKEVVNQTTGKSTTITYTHYDITKMIDSMSQKSKLKKYNKEIRDARERVNAELNQQNNTA
ncbi:MAG: hypothetical protein QMB37_07565 [Paludibacteraceae bacterium]